MHWLYVVDCGTSGTRTRNQPIDSGVHTPNMLWLHYVLPKGLEPSLTTVKGWRLTPILSTAAFVRYKEQLEFLCCTSALTTLEQLEIIEISSQPWQGHALTVVL